MEFNKTYNRDEFLNFLRRDFLPDDFSQVNEPVVFATKTTYSKQATKLGVCKSLDLVVYEIKHSGKDDPRVGLSKEAFRMLSEEWQSRALVLFVPETNANNYRFSLIEIKLEGDQTSAKVHRKYSNPRRYSYILGEGIGTNTPMNYLARVDRNGVPTKVSDEKDLTNRFSVEVLTKAFYNELSDWYAWAIDSVEFPGMRVIEEADKKNEHKSKNVIRLLTRLLFVWFLKQKRLIPDELFDVEYLAKNLLKSFNPHLQSGLFKEKSIDSIYYKSILQNLFFATLNCPITPQSSEDKRERGFRKMDNWGQNFGHDHLMRYEKYFSNPIHFLELVNERVPFLNGGLFDCLDDKEYKVYIDGFSDNLIKPNQLIVPDYLFFGEVEGKGRDVSGFYGDKKKSKTDILGLIDILKKYNFTIEENMPFDQEVSLDPELLGKVFENLLASYNPETKTTARKQTGSFYTPREIVQYMVDESLVAHLKRTVGEKLEEKYRKLMQYTDEDLELTKAQKSDIIRSLQNCKVLDPACGSGAFPVGVLQQMVHILSQLDPCNEIWKDLILEESVRELGSTLRDCTDEERKEVQDDINRNFDDGINRPDYARKLYLIEKCIYGVDIQSIAVQISKLRFFISLVVDQKPTSDRTDNFGIRPLPNLEAKFVAANTLIGLKKEKNLFDNRDIDKLQTKLTQASHRIFGAKSNKSKNRWKERVVELQTQIAEQLEVLSVVSPEDAKLMREWKMFDQNASSPFFDPEWMFGVSSGFDIVIGNPPYGVSIKGQYRKDVETHLGKVPDYEIYYYFIEIARKLLSDTGVLSYIIPNTYLFNTFAAKYRLKLLSEWNMIEVLDCTSFPIFEKATVLNTINTWRIGSSQAVGYRNTSNISNFEDLIKRERLTIDVDSLTEMNKNWGLAFSLDNNTIDVVNNIRNNKKHLNDIFQVSQGYIPYRKSDLVKTYGNAEGANIVTDRLWHSKTRIDNDYIQEIFGKDISKYGYNASGMFVKYGRHVASYVDPLFFTSPRLLIREITNPGIIACLIEESYINDPQIISVINNQNTEIKNYSLSILWAILNSKLATFYHFNSSPKATKGAFPKILVQDIKEFPLPEVSIEEADTIKALVDYVQYIAKCEKPINEYANNQALRSIFEGVIDSTIYELYFRESINKMQLNVLLLLESDIKDVLQKSMKEQINLLFDKWNDYSGEYRNKMLLMPVKCLEVQIITKTLK